MVKSYQPPSAPSSTMMRLTLHEADDDDDMIKWRPQHSRNFQKNWINTVDMTALAV